MNKSLTLVCEGLPTIDASGTGNAITITADNCIVKGFTCVNAYQAGLRVESNNNVIEDNTCKNNDIGIVLETASENIIAHNTAKNNEKNGIYLQDSNKYGFWLYNYSTDNILANNTATSNSYGIYIVLSSNNNIYLNNFVDNTDNAYSYNSNNIWRSASKLTHTYNSKSYWNYLGNYWSDYRGSDTNGDGIGDSYYSIDGNGDEHPLMKPRKNYFAP